MKVERKNVLTYCGKYQSMRSIPETIKDKECYVKVFKENRQRS